MCHVTAFHPRRLHHVLHYLTIMPCNEQRHSVYMLKTRLSGDIMTGKHEAGGDSFPSEHVNCDMPVEVEQDMPTIAQSCNASRGVVADCLPCSRATAGRATFLSAPTRTRPCIGTSPGGKQSWAARRGRCVQLHWSGWPPSERECAHAPLALL